MHEPHLLTVDAARYCGFRSARGLLSAFRRGKVYPVGRRGRTGSFTWRRADLDAYLRGEDPVDPSMALVADAGRHELPSAPRPDLGWDSTGRRFAVSETLPAMFECITTDCVPPSRRWVLRLAMAAAVGIVRWRAVTRSPRPTHLRFVAPVSELVASHSIAARTRSGSRRRVGYTMKSSTSWGSWGLL